ncbi:rod shape-determining protein RodA [candidate division KSB1 bacterium]|nr:rod shape-determining protein RodA [candidate division KSB1 bacterium]
MLRFNEIKISNADYILVIVVFILIATGLMAIYSASYQVESPVLQANFTRQIVWMLVGTTLMLIVIIIPTGSYSLAAYWLYGISIAILILTLILNRGEAVSRWISIAGIRFQPAELTKLSIILVLARYLSEDKRNLNRMKDITFAFGIAAIPFILIARQPDLGTALVCLAILLPVLYWAGLPTFFLFVVIAPLLVMIASFNYYTFFLAMVLVAILLLLFKRGHVVSLFIMLLNIGVGIITPLMWNQLHDYQKLRILTFLGIEIDPQGYGYQIIQSKVAIGSGGLLGKGLLNGTQTQLRFLPAQHTDFVFSVIGEEAGFIGSIFVILLFLFIILRGIYVASAVRNRYASLMVIGAVTVLGFHVVVNIGMTVGMMPVTGIPLPFLSYGGSFLISCMILIGLIINASIRRFKY